MHFVTEKRTSGQRNVSDLMAFDTVTLDRECCFAFMTASTGLTLLHLQHRVMRITPVGLEQPVMTISATVHAQVFFMTEYKCSEIRDRNRYRINRMTSGAAAELRRTGIAFIMAGAA